MLNAFRHQRKNQALALLGVNVWLIRVLNAFRHQRKNQMALPARDYFRQLVLNAFRHQRKNQESFLTASETRSRCSTPFGIRGRIRLDFRGVETGQVSVLNAFRHQRKNQDALFMAFMSPSICAQRLSASEEESAPRSLLATPRLPDTCSTPFGIRGRIGENTTHARGRRPACSTPFGIRGRIGRE